MTKETKPAFTDYRGHEMREEKPTAYLHCLRSLAGDQCGDPVLRSLFMEQLPEPIRAVPAISDTTNLQRLAEMADKALDVIKSTVASTQVVPAKMSDIQTNTGTT